jgi:transcriptional regulator with XRE-family HTH domain
MDWYLIDRVRNLRIEKKMSQVRLAIAMELAEGFISKVENPRERAKYNIRHLNLLAKAFKCSPLDLLPAEPLPYDMVKVTLRIEHKGKKKKVESNFLVLKIEESTSKKQKKS